ncbi:D-alanyl-D-alanine carboxypeptidase [Mycoplasmatota bacterium]|nr:D-alanyl-D-alanine carboxypeptidase [Mycoplasmatota bacterium]
MKKKTIFIMSLFLLFCIPFKVNKTNAQVSVSAKAAALMNADTGEFMFTQNPNEKLPIASLTKIMTAILALENANLSDEVTISEEAANQPPSSINLTPGDKLTLEDLLYGLILRSGNDAAYAIAEYVAGNVDDFVRLMNDKAKALGMNDTNFSNPSGLPDPRENISTASDVAKLLRYAMENPEFRKIAGTKIYETTSALGIPYKWAHKHRLVNQVDYVTAGKTGFTKAAGRTLASYAKENGISLIAVTLNDPNDWVDHLNMFKYGFGQYGIDVPTPEIRSDGSEEED